jgi:thiosulfate/3-mercaptopyruvate sulfurtransferase
MAETPLNLDLLWSPEQVDRRRSAPGLSIVDTRPAELFSSGRIPGARHFDPYFVNCDDTSDRALASFTRMWANLLGWRGVKPNDTIVFYGAFSDMCAARCFWFTEYLGHKDVHVLDGGIGAWEAAGFEIETTSAPPTPVKFACSPEPERVATYEHVLQAITDNGSVILDNRSLGEFNGTDRRATHGGAVPSARHCDWEILYDHTTGKLKEPEALRRLFEAVGATPDKKIIVYCNTGYRSAHAYLAMRLLGYPSVRNYVGSWQEWGNRDDLPIRLPAQ